MCHDCQDLGTCPFFIRWLMIIYRIWLYIYHRFDLCGPWLDFVLFLVLFWPRTILSRRWPSTMGRSSPPIPMYLDLRWVSAENWHVDLKARDLRKGDVIKNGSAKIRQVLVCLGGSSQTWWFFYCSLMKSCRLFTYIINIYLYISKLYH